MPSPQHPARVPTRLGALALLSALSLAACSPTGGAHDGGAPVSLPPTSGVLDYQLGGAYAVDGLAVVVRDASDEPADGAYSVCYVNGFQTQPGESATWLAEHPDLLLHDAAGGPVVDPAWPDEYVLDPSSPEQRAGILAVLEPVVRGCAEAGFDAVELDNLDTFARFTDAGGGAIDEAGALTLASEYVRIAHEVGLAVGQKNAAEIAGLAREEIGFDFAVVEECAFYDECGVYREVYGEHVLQVEYADQLRTDLAAVCADPDRSPLTILRDRDLTVPGDPGYVREQC